MALFGSETTQSPEVVSYETPKEGVVKPSLLAGADDLVDTALNIFESKKKSKESDAVADFILKQAAVADAYAQGSRTAAYAQSMMRKNLVEAISNNKSLTKEFMNAQRDFVGLTGGGEVVKKKTDEERRRDSLVEKGIEAGIIPLNATPAQEDEGIALMRSYAQADREYTEMSRTIDLELKNMNLSSAQRAEKEAKKKELAMESVKKGSPVLFLETKQAYEDIVSGGGSEAEKIQAIEDYFLALQSGASAKYGADLDANQYAILMKPFEEMKKMYIERATGALDDAEVQRGLDRAMNAQKAIIASDPYLMNIIAADALGLDFGVYGGSISTDVVRRLTNIQAGNSSDKVDTPSPFSTESNNKQAYEKYIDLINNGFESGDASKRSGAVQHLDSLLGSLGDGEGQIKRDPKKARDIVDIISKPSFYKAIKNGQAELTNLEEAANILEMHYADEVWGMVKREFLNSKVVAGGQVPGTTTSKVDTTSLVSYRSTNSGMEFFPLDPSSHDSRQAARDMNSKLKPVINKTVQAFSHLEGNNNYKQMWEKVNKSLFGEQIEGGAGNNNVAGGDAGDDLTMDDFTFPTVSTSGVPADVAEDQEFLGEVERVSSKFEIDPSVLMAVMDFETGGTFNPAEKNKAGSSGTGLIQFMSKTAKGLGTSTTQLASMSRAEQMSWVERYLDQYEEAIKGGDAEDVYMAVLFPRAIGKSGGYVVFREGTKAYTDNKGLDSNGDGTVTKREAARKVVSLVGKHENT